MIDQNDYIQAFSRYMRSGEDTALSGFLAEDQNAAFLRIYRNGFYKACLTALQANFISLTYLLDESQFNQIATQYINLYPPVQATLVAYGMEESFNIDSRKLAISFPVFLGQIKQHDLTSSQTFSDIAILDQAWFSTLNKLNQNLVSLAQVHIMLEQGQDLSLIPFTLVDSVSLVSIQSDVFLHWQALRFRGERKTESPIKGIQHILFWQFEGEVQAKLLSVLECRFYQKFLASRSLSDALETTAQLDDEFDISALFADLLNASLLRLED